MQSKIRFNTSWLNDKRATIFQLKEEIKYVTAEDNCLYIFTKMKQSILDYLLLF